MTETLSPPHTYESQAPQAGERAAGYAHATAGGDLREGYDYARTAASSPQSKINERIAAMEQHYPTPPAAETEAPAGADAAAAAEAAAADPIDPNADPALAIAAAGPYDMWQPVIQRAELPKPDRSEWQAAADSKDPWVRSLDAKQVTALDSMTSRYHGVEQPETEPVEVPAVAEASPSGPPVEAVDQATKDAALASVEAQYAEKRADLAMIPELDEDVQQELAGLDPAKRRAIEKVIYWQQKRDRQRAQEAAAPADEVARQAEVRKGRRAVRWLAQGLMRSNVAMNGHQIR